MAQEAEKREGATRPGVRPPSCAVAEIESGMERPLGSSVGHLQADHLCLKGGVAQLPMGVLVQMPCVQGLLVLKHGRLVSFSCGSSAGCRELLRSTETASQTSHLSAYQSKRKAHRNVRGAPGITLPDQTPDLATHR